MTLCLAMMYTDRDLPWVKLHLPTYMDAFGKAPLLIGYDPHDYGQESHRFFMDLDANIQMYPATFRQNWSEFFNKLIEFGEWLHVDSMLRLDPDELVWPDDIPRIAELMEHYSFLTFPRYNFWYDRTKWHRDGAYPDFQGRAWRLDGRFRYIGARHEGISFNGTPDECFIPDIHIYHYGDIGTKNIQERALRYWNYNLMDKGLPLVDKLPDDVHPGANVEPFNDKQPLEPADIGKYAPFDN